ncbi:unnamed protein product [Paramecium pentaurelia]|uniref:Tubulin/FtsZ GTPase domain-containing protein n=1 Tax=Paramecium pentaurelia TaxID=43138 RepID=A0A8S1WXZ2_9CILI|nr:unnamed protein product [Paramecium pentaurelia]
MQEIIIIGIGQSGINIGLEFIKQLNYDHCLNNHQEIINQDRYNKKINVFYNENSRQQFIPRCLFLDLESSQIDKLLLQKDVIIDPNCCFSMNCGSGNLFAIGKYTEGAELMDKCKHVLNRYFEQSGNLQGIMMFFSTGGGSGSGMASNLIQYFREKDLTKIVHCNPVFSQGVIHNYLEIYNTVLILHQMIETVDIVTVFDNVALQYICNNNNLDSNYDNYNKIIAESLIQTTASYRFPGFINGGMKKLALNLIPFPRLHFFQPSYMIINQSGWSITNILNKQYKLCSFQDYLPNEYISYQIQLRGNCFEMPESQSLLIRKDDLYQFLGHDTHYRTHTSVQHIDHENIVGFLGNSNGFKKYMQSYQEDFIKMFRKKAYVYAYEYVGMDQMEFTEAEYNMNDLISEYGPFIHSCCHSEYDNYEEEEEY